MESPETLVAAITALAIAIADAVPDVDELSVVGAAFTQLGDTITTIAVQRALIAAKSKSGDEDKKS